MSAQQMTLVLAIPPEIRNDIYRQSFSKTYLVPTMSAGVCQTTSLLRKLQESRKAYARPSANRVGVFGISKTMALEAEHIFYFECTFRFAIFNTSMMSSAPSQHVADPMQNVEFSLNMISYDEFYYQEWDLSGNVTVGIDRTTSKCKGWELILAKFSGSEIKRKACRVIFDHCSPKHHPLDTSTAFFSAVGGLCGFETLIIQLDCPSFNFKRISRAAKSSLADPDIASERVVTWVDGNPYANRPSPFDGMRKAIQRTLQAKLGPSTSYNNQCSRFLEFHPRRHLIKQGKVLA